MTGIQRWEPLDRSELLNSQDPIHVAVAVVRNKEGRFLIALRPDIAHQGRLWEFPGGKIEAGEDVLQALKRELREETGIVLESASPLIRIGHNYVQGSVLLDVWYSDKWSGEATGCEGQQIRWVFQEEFDNYKFPVANTPIISAIRLPVLYLVSPEPGKDWARFLTTLEECLDAGVRLFQFRSFTLGRDDFCKLAKLALNMCRQYDARLILNGSPGMAAALDADGVHLSSIRLLQMDNRPMGQDFIIAASCHNAMQLEHASRLGVDFSVLSPVQQTSSHPEAEPLGWRKFGELLHESSVPVYALGGMQSSDGLQVRNLGGQGVAMLSAVWGSRNPAAVVRDCLSAL